MAAWATSARSWISWMEPEARQLISENLHKNYIDHEEYPMTNAIEERCVAMLAKLFNECDSKEISR